MIQQEQSQENTKTTLPKLFNELAKEEIGKFNRALFIIFQMSS
jgi:hypothetical protein